MDYLYWFLILGVSKLRPGGRFGFITTEYWLRAAGAQPLRRYLARRCKIDRIVLFRDFRLFPDAPGQHSMIITGTRLAPPDLSPHFDAFSCPSHPPKVSIYTGPSVTDERNRADILAAVRDARSAGGVRTFTGSASPNDLKQASWAEVVLTAAQARARRRLREQPQVAIRLDKGVETTANKLVAGRESLLTATQLGAVGGSGSRPGIQLLSPAEVRGLGPLNEAEQKALRRWINTRDVFPYAVVPASDAHSVIYLAKDSRERQANIEQAVRTVPFPAGLPHLEAHLTRFRPLLEQITISHRERRPWWSLHRPRTDVLDNAGDAGNGWAPFCLTDRWGPGGRLIVGLAPVNSCPASGLHAIRPLQGGVTPAYITALLNSAMYQEITATIPPGQLRKEDIEALGLPYRPQDVSRLEMHALQLARLVTTMINSYAAHFPLLRSALRADVALKAVPDESWTPGTGSATTWGALRGLAWVDHVHYQRAVGTRLGDVRCDDATLFGMQVIAEVRGDHNHAAAVTIALKDHDGVDKTAESLARVLRGLAETGGCVRDVADLRLPVSPHEMVTLNEQHAQSLEALCTAYRDHRRAIDEILAR